MRTFLIGNALGAFLGIATLKYAPLNVLYTAGSIIIAFAVILTYLKRDK